MRIDRPFISVVVALFSVVLFTVSARGEQVAKPVAVAQGGETVHVSPIAQPTPVEPAPVALAGQSTPSSKTAAPGPTKLPVRRMWRSKFLRSASSGPMPLFPAHPAGLVPP